MPQSVGSASNHRWYYVGLPLLLYGMVFIIGSYQIAILATSHDFLQTMGLLKHPVGIGLLFSIPGFMSALGAWAWGYPADLIGPRRTVVLGLLIWGLAIVAAGLSTSYNMLLIMMVVAVFGQGAFWTISMRYIGNWFHVKERGRAQATYVAGFNLGPALATPLLVSVLHNLGWRAVFFSVAAMILVILLGLFLLLTKDTPEMHRGIAADEAEFLQSGQRIYAKEAQSLRTQRLGSALSSSRFWLVTITNIVSGSLFYGLATWIPSYLEKSRHFSSGAMSLWVSGSWLLAVLMVVATALLVDRMRRPALVAGITLVIMSIFLTITITVSSPILAVIAMGLGLALWGGAETTAGKSLYLSLAGPEIVGRATGVITGIGELLGRFAPTAMGFLIAAAGGSFTGALYFSVGSALVGAIAYFILALSESRQLAVLQRAEVDVLGTQQMAE